MSKHLLRLTFVLGMVLGVLALRGDGVAINEIMYHPASTNLPEEWFELHNSGTNTVDLSGWRTAKTMRRSCTARAAGLWGSQTEESKVRLADQQVGSGCYRGTVCPDATSGIECQLLGEA